MLSSRKNLIFLLCLISASILIGHPSFSETTILEQTLAGDIIIKEMYEPGSGLPVGKIQSVWGEAIVFHRDPTVGYRIQTGLPLYPGDIMHTRATAWILCRLVDGSNIVLAPETTLTILQSSYNSVRNAGVSFLYLKHGGARFELNPMPGLTSYDFKVQTETAFTLAREADFIVKANSEATEIIAFEKSRLEITGMAQPEEITFLSDFQRAIVTQEMISPTIETLSRDDIETMMADFHPVPQSTWLAGGTTPKNNRQDHKIDEKPVE